MTGLKSLPKSKPDFICTPFSFAFHMLRAPKISWKSKGFAFQLLWLLLMSCDVLRHASLNKFHLPHQKNNYNNSSIHIIKRRLC